VGGVEADEARAMVDVCLDAGVNLFDSADVYSAGRSEEVLGQAIAGRRDEVLVATKVFVRMGDGANDLGLSRRHIVRACEDSLRRLGTDYIDLYQAHGFDALTPLEETLAAFDDLVRSGKVRYIGCSNYSGWQLMKALSVADAAHGARYVSQQVYYSLAGRDAENELVPLGIDQGVAVIVWSPLAAGFLTGKFRRDGASPEGARRAVMPEPPLPPQAFDIVDALVKIAQERDVSPTQVALNWLTRKPGVTSVSFGARTMEQLKDNLGAASWSLSDEEMDTLNAVSDVAAPYPYWHQRKYAVVRNPPLPSVRPA
jgi:aryl-alcohol dehydrogenase-like predicted oxidoreductase